MLRKLWKWFKRLILFFLLSIILMVLIYRWVPVLVTPLMLIRSIEHVFSGEMPRMHKKWIPINEISRHMPKAVMAGKDQNFMNHSGFDFKAMKNAFKYNKKVKRKEVVALSVSKQQKMYFYGPNVHTYEKLLKHTSLF